MTTQIKTLRAAIFRPTTSISGNEPPTIFRGQNLMLRGNSTNPYFEVFGGNKDLNENFNLDTANHKLTGTLGWTAGNEVISGTTTTFVSQLHIGQMILAGAEVFVVKEVVSDLSFISARKPTTTLSGQTGYRLPQMFAIEGKRGVMLTGNAIQMEKGHIIAVGSGELFINGQPLAGTSLIASNKPKAAIYRPSTNDYIVQNLGFTSVPPQPVINLVTGGTKGMPDGKKFSFMISYWAGSPEGTDGYSNPCEVIKLDGAAVPIAISGANNRFEFDFTTSLVGMPANAQGFIIYGSLAGKDTISVSGATTTVISPNETNYQSGPWYKVAEVLTADLAAGDKFTFEYLDSDVLDVVTGDNDAPPDCEFVAKMEGKPLYISCYGRRKVGGANEGSNPGPTCVPSKFGNPDGAPTEWAASLTNNIIGWFEGVGRWFMMTQNSLDFVVSTGLLGSSVLGSAPLELPIISRPYWKTGAANRYSITIIDDTLYGFSGNKMFRSVGNGDENVKKYEFGAPIKDITQSWVDGYVLTSQDSKNNNVCFIYSAAFKNQAGYWCSVILPFALDSALDAWLPLIVLSSNTRDMIVSGVAVVNERLEFLCGGRVQGGTFQTKTYRFDEDDPANPVTSMPYYLIWQPSDDGVEDLCKQIHSLRPEGKFTGLKAQIHGSRPGGELIISDMENGTNSLSGDMTFADSDEITMYLKRKAKLKNLGKYAIRLSGTWNGSGMKDRLDELDVEVSAHGKRR